MTDELMTIREMCEAFQVTPRTLRFYEARELLFPLRPGLVRLFTRRDRARLRVILEGKRFGFQLEEIRQFLDLYDQGPDGPRRQLQRGIEMGTRRLAMLEAEQVALAARIDELRHWLEEARQQLAQRKKGAVA